MPIQTWIYGRSCAFLNGLLDPNGYPPYAMQIMNATLGQTLTAFDDALTQFRAGLASSSRLTEAVFVGSEGWSKLLTYKLIPHLAGEGCLIVAVMGGTNTGKSTVFNLLLGQPVSPVLPTAAATRHPVLAASARRAAQCLEGKVVPEFSAEPLSDVDAVVSKEGKEDKLYVAVAEVLPDRLILFDTPDIDSIETGNWSVAEDLQAAGDVCIAVLTAEKYKDERVVEFFRRAAASGRVVLPVMNKADAQGDFEVARRQLDEFCEAVGSPMPCFVVPHDPAPVQCCATPIVSVNDKPDLREYLDSLDVAAIKERVYGATVDHFASHAGGFLDRVADMAGTLRAVKEDFERRAAGYSAQYDPAPGAAIGGLFHEFVQSKRGFVRRLIGSTGKTVAQGASAVVRSLAGRLWKRPASRDEDRARAESELRAMHKQAIERITRDLIKDFVESGRNLREPAVYLLDESLNSLNADIAISLVTQEVLHGESVSREFREHALRMLEAWWEDHAGRRRALEALDTLLAVVPTAIAAPLSAYMGGVGVPEAVAVTGPVAEQFVARVVEFQFGDAMFDFLTPWKVEQQQLLEGALNRHITDPSLRKLRRFLDVLDGELTAEMRKWQRLCRTA